MGAADCAFLAIFLAGILTYTWILCHHTREDNERDDSLCY